MPQNQENQAPENTRKTKTVVFDKSLGPEKSFQVEFSERGFSVGDTRLSFEYLEDSMNKNITLTLSDGTVIDSIKGQKILKYKYLFPKPSQQKKAEETAKSAPSPETSAAPVAPIAEVIDESVEYKRKKLLEEKAEILKSIT